MEETFKVQLDWGHFGDLLSEEHRLNFEVHELITGMGRDQASCTLNQRP